MLMTRDDQGRPANDPNFDADNTKQWGCTFLSLHEPSDPTDAWVKSAVPGENDSYYNEAKTEALIDQPEMIELFQMFSDLRCVYHGMPTPGEAVGQGDQWQAQLCAMCFGHHSTTFFAKQAKVKYNYDVTFTPAGPFGQFAGISASAFGVTSKAAYPEEAWLFVKFFTGEEIQSIIGEQKRWGVQHYSIVDAIEPDDGIPEHFAMVHTDSWKKDVEQKVKPWGTVAAPYQSELKQIYATEFDGIMTCAGGTAAEAAQKAKPQLDEVLAKIDW